MDLELHFSVCKTCAAEFNEQKKLLCALDFALDEKPEFALPEDFTRTVVIKAESNVSGLRRREERFRALFLCASLFLLIIFGLGSETEAVFSTFAVFIEQIFAVGGFVVHLIFDIAFALTAILRLDRRSVYSQLAFCDLGFRRVFYFVRLYFLAHSDFIRPLEKFRNQIKM